MFDWIREHGDVFWVLGIFSIACFSISLVVIPWMVIRLPQDYFGRSRRAPGQPLASARQRVWFAVKNIAGVILIFAGVAMLVLPGQGIITILIGVGLMDFPGKHRLEQRVLRQRSVLNTMNWLREKAGRGPLRLDEPA